MKSDEIWSKDTTVTSASSVTKDYEKHYKTLDGLFL